MLNKYNELLKIAQEEYPSLYNELIFIEEDQEFSVTTAMEMHCIYVTTLKRDNYQLWLENYLNTEYGLNASEHMYFNFYEAFAFLHEVGHIYYNDMNYDVETIYKNYKGKTYKNYNEAWKAYRQLENEKIADQFAVTIMEKHIYKIWSIMNDITEEQAKKEYEVWDIWNMEE